MTSEDQKMALARALTGTPPEPGDEELVAAFAAGGGTKEHEHLWRALGFNEYGGAVYVVQSCPCGEARSAYAPRVGG